jgi:hypothetical protein
MTNLYLTNPKGYAAVEVVLRRLTFDPEYRSHAFAEHRSRYATMPALSKGPKPLQVRPRKRRTTAEVAMQLDELAVRARAQDRKLRELGLL